MKVGDITFNMQSSQFKLAVSTKTAVERIVVTFAKLIGECDQVDFGVFSQTSVYVSATDDEKARDILAVASVVNSAFALTPVHRVNTIDESSMSVSTIQKVKCERCGFHVNPQGHQDRCEVRLPSPGWLKTMAWLGDSLLGAHIRILLVVSSGIDGAKFQMFTSNSRLAIAYDHVPTTFLGDDFRAVGASNESLGTVVEAAYALSFEYRYRLMEYFSFTDSLHFAFSDVSLSSTIHHMMSNKSLMVSPNRHVFGYCYMCLLPGDTSVAVAKSLGPFVEYGKIKSYLIGHKVKKKWYISHQFGNVYHVSLRDSSRATSLLSYSSDIGLLDTDVLGASIDQFSDFSDTESDGGFASDSVKDKNISVILVSRELTADWGQKNVELFTQSAVIAQALVTVGGTRPWVICASAYTLSLFEGVFSVPATTTSSQLEAVLERLVSALTAAVRMLPVSQNLSYIATSGLISLVRT